MEHCSLLDLYLNKAKEDRDPAAVSFFAGLDVVRHHHLGVAKSIIQELLDQRSNLKLIASENYCSLAVQIAQGNLLTDKYAEGYPGHRFYAGCDNVDDIEAEACSLACRLFNAQHAYVQPHSGADANLVAYVAILSQRVQKPILEDIGETDPSAVPAEVWRRIREATQGQRLLALDYYAGGHLSHGYRRNFSSLLFDAHTYGVDPVTGLIDMDALERRARDVRPLILLAGYSAYPRKLNFARFREIADSVGAVLMVDMAHFAGLVAAGVFKGEFDPIPYADIVTATTHKTLRGPRGGLVLCRKDLADYVDKGCPAILGGPLPHVIAAKAVAFKEALSSDFAAYGASVVANAQVLAEELQRPGQVVLTGGTDNHIVMLDVSRRGAITGRQAESALRECGVTVNRNSIANDPNGPWYTSGLRLGTAAISTLGMGRSEVAEIAHLIAKIVDSVQPKKLTRGPNLGEFSKANYTLAPEVRDEARSRVRDLMRSFPPYPEIDSQVTERAARMLSEG